MTEKICLLRKSNKIHWRALKKNYEIDHLYGVNVPLWKLCLNKLDKKSYIIMLKYIASYWSTFHDSTQTFHFWPTRINKICRSTTVGWFPNLWNTSFGSYFCIILQYVSTYSRATHLYRTNWNIIYCGYLYLYLSFFLSMYVLTYFNLFTSK